MPAQELFAIVADVNTESVARPSCFFSIRYVAEVTFVQFVYFDYMLESCLLKTRNFIGSQLVHNI